MRMTIVARWSRVESTTTTTTTTTNCDVARMHLVHCFSHAVIGAKMCCFENQWRIPTTKQPINNNNILLATTHTHSPLSHTHTSTRHILSLTTAPLLIVSIARLREKRLVAASRARQTLHVFTNHSLLSLSLSLAVRARITDCIASSSSASLSNVWYIQIDRHNTYTTPLRAYTQHIHTQTHLHFHLHLFREKDKQRAE